MNLNIFSWQALGLLALSVFLYGLSASFPHLWILAIPLELVGLVIIMFGRTKTRDLKPYEKTLLLVNFRIFIILSGTPWLVGTFGTLFPGTNAIEGIISCYGIGYVVCAGIFLCYVPLVFLKKQRSSGLQLLLFFLVMIFWEYGVYLWPASSWLSLGFSDYTAKVFYLLGHNGTKYTFIVIKALILWALLRGILNFRRSILAVTLMTALLIAVANILPTNVPTGSQRVTFALIQDGSFSAYGQGLSEALKTVQRVKDDLNRDPTDVVVWSENFFVGREPIIIKTLKDLEQEIPAQHIAGSAGFTEHAYQSNVESILKGEIQRQSKGTAFPIGEYIPFLQLWKSMGLLPPERINIETDANYVAFNVAKKADIKFLGLVCLDAFNPWLISSRVSAMKNRPEKIFLVEIYNETLFGTARAARQHLALMRVMSASFRLPMVHAGQAGISAIINADGSLRTQMPYGEKGILRGDLVF